MLKLNMALSIVVGALSFDTLELLGTLIGRQNMSLLKLEVMDEWTLLETRSRQSGLADMGTTVCEPAL